MATPQHLRVFLASPGDVADERSLVRCLLKEELPYDPFLRGRVTFDLVSWDNPVARTPMPAGLTPQEAVIRFETKPSDCDVVVVVLWSRLGTHLDLIKFQKPNGGHYLSGTEWEYEDACKGKPEIFIYRRTEVPKVDLNDPDYEEKRRQYQLVGQFCERISQNPDGSFRGNVTDYDTPTAFEERLTTDLKRLLRDRLDERDAGSAVGEAQAWTGSPYPGLRPFTTKEAVIFFGRGREVDALIARLRDPAQRFLAVVGASGTGKSSIVRAGLIPRLKNGALEGSQDWRVVTCTPGATGDNPFLALAVGLTGVLPAHAQKSPVEIATALAQAPQHISDNAVAPTGGAALLFVDQLEELFTHAAAPYREPFGALLAHAAGQAHLRVVATLRADFLLQGATLPYLAPLVQGGTFVLSPPGPGALADMIRKPAERAGLELQDGLADEILKDAGNDPGALPLMAFCLEELYRQTALDHRLTLDAYDALGRLRGAISRRAGALLGELRDTAGADLDAVMPQVFQVLVHVDSVGTVTRRRAFQDDLGETAPIPMILEKLVKGRLLTAEDAGGRATVTLAHEALLLEWPELRDWLDQHGKALALREQIEDAAAEWESESRAESCAWLEARIVDAVRKLTRSSVSLDDVARPDVVRAFLGPTDPDEIVKLPSFTEAQDGTVGSGRYGEAWRLPLGHAARASTGVRLALLGDHRKGVRLRTDGQPDIDWRRIDAGEVTIEIRSDPDNPNSQVVKRRTRTVERFWMARYPVTIVQFQAFLNECYRDGAWRLPAGFADLPATYPPPKDRARHGNHPADAVNWWDAQAFCHWLGARLGFEVRLPTEYEWQRAATGGDPARTYPWGPDWDPIQEPWRANTFESGLGRSTAVGMYPAGASLADILDMAGTVWEWCQNAFDDPDNTAFPASQDDRRALRGGSWGNYQGVARSAFRGRSYPARPVFNVGFRVVCSSPS